MPTNLDLAMQDYGAAMADAHMQILKEECAGNDADRASGIYQVYQAMSQAFALYIGSRADYPVILTNEIFNPHSLTCMGPNPDYLYHWAMLGGDRTYRLWGIVHDSDWVAVQAMTGYWGDTDTRMIANLDLKNWLQPDGSFEFFVGPDPVPGKFWIQSDRQAPCFLNIRDCTTDWAVQDMAEFNIELTSPATRGPRALREEELADRLMKASRYIKKVVAKSKGFLHDTLNAAGGYNRFTIVGPTPERLANSSVPDQVLLQAVYDLRPDEALIVEQPVIACRYWGVQLADIWLQTSDYTFHQTTLNNSNVHVDPDGKIRYVVAKQDPGIGNWLDTTDHDSGHILSRMYQPERYTDLPTPTTRIVPSGDVRTHLPASTPAVPAKERRARLAVRANAVARRGRCRRRVCRASQQPDRRGWKEPPCEVQNRDCT